MFTLLRTQRAAAFRELRAATLGAMAPRAAKLRTAVSPPANGPGTADQADIPPATPEPQQAPAQAPADADLPWYMREDIKSPLLDEKKTAVPPVPAHAPAHVSEFLGLLASDYGMDNLLLFDMADLDENHEYKANNRGVDYIIMATGKSERHILKAATEFRTHIKHKYQVLPGTEGLVSTAKTPAMRRKLLRRARKGPSSTDNEYGRAANSWVLFHHDSVDVHLMTADRRQDLNLEAIWCRAEDSHLYEQTPAPPVDSDHIFSGVRYLHTRAGPSRGLHADAANASPSGPALAPERHLERLLAQPANVGQSTLTRLREHFDADFRGSGLSDFRAKYAFYKAVHLHCPEAVSFDDAEAALLEKYASAAAAGDMAGEKIDDVTEYAKLLLDSPAIGSGCREDSDVALGKLASFISVLYRFSSDRFCMAANAAFIPLLWRLTFWETGAMVTPRLVDQFVRGRQVAHTPSGEPSVTLASNNARNVLTLLDFHNKTAGTGSCLTPQFKEALMYTYGNAGKWDDFWDEWNSVFFPACPGPASALTQWVRLVVFLSLVGNRAQNLHFLNSYWKTGSAVSGTFTECFEANGSKFGSADEQQAFCRAMGSMVDSLDPTGDIYVELRAQLVELASTD